MPVTLTVESIRKMGETGLVKAVEDPALMEKFTVVLAQAGLVRAGTHGTVTEVEGRPVQPVVVWTMDAKGNETSVQTCFFPK